MKICIHTPRAWLLNAKKKSTTAFWWLFIIGLLCLPYAAYAGVPLLGLAIYFFLRRRKIIRLIEQQDANTTTAAEARKQAAQEAVQARLAATEAKWKRFQDENELVRTMHTKVVGVTFRNDDGSSRQEILSRCFDGDPVEFEYYTYKGSPAYAVYCGGDQIGNLSADLARKLYEMQDTYTFVGEVAEVTGGYDGLTYGCNISIDLYRQKQPAADLPTATGK